MKQPAMRAMTRRTRPTDSFHDHLTTLKASDHHCNEYVTREAGVRIERVTASWVPRFDMMSHGPTSVCELLRCMCIDVTPHLPESSTM